MADIDTDKPAEQSDRKPLAAGIDLWQIKTAKESKSEKSGANMFTVELNRVSMLAQKYPDRVTDYIMLEGGGWGIGKEKLMAVLGGPFKGKLDALDLVNKRVWLSTGIEKYSATDKKTGEIVEREKLKVLVSDPKQSNGFAWCGIQTEKNVPAGHALPGEDVPF